MDNPYKFLGTAKRYRKLTGVLGWGDFCVRNERRSGRKQPLHPGDCPFCGISASEPAPHQPRLVTFCDESYFVAENNNPIVENQRLIIPAASGNGVHRLDLNATDVRLAMRLARDGFASLLPDEDHRRWACYVNALPGTGRSIAHLHINAVPADSIPLLANVSAQWQICSCPPTGSTISRVPGVGFYALAIENPDDVQLGAAVADVHRRMNEWQQPYNFLAFPGTEPGAVRVLMVPRDNEYCEAADQRVAGLEFLTGVLIPGDARWKVIDTILRDRALWQATLKRDRQLQLERRLRGLYGLPPAGHLVGARVQANVYEPVVEENDVLDAGADEPIPAAEANAVFGKIDGRDWTLPRSSDEEPTYHGRRVNANVLVRVTRASICQSDRRVLGKEKSATDVARIALGHEGGGYIVDPGPWDGELMSGDKVVVLPHLSCGECDACHRYTPNLCERMEHLGFHLHGNLADLMAFPYQCVLPVGSDFPDDAMPLVEPLACVLRALFRLRVAIRRLADKAETPSRHQGRFTIFGGGPMGCLTAIAVRRNWRNVPIRIVEPNPHRRAELALWADRFEIVDEVAPPAMSAISYVASSNYAAVDDAIRTTEFGGTVLLFAGINKAQLDGGNAEFQGRDLEQIHRREQLVRLDYDFVKRVYLIGSSGYILDDVKRSLVELRHHYTDYYRDVQNVSIQGLTGGDVVYVRSGKAVSLGRPAVEALLSPRGVEDQLVASSLKVLIRLSEAS